MHSLLQQAVELLVSRFDSTTLVPLAACACMACVQLPSGLQVATRGATAPQDLDAKSLQVWSFHALRHVSVGRQIGRLSNANDKSLNILRTIQDMWHLLGVVQQQVSIRFHAAAALLNMSLLYAVRYLFAVIAGN